MLESNAGINTKGLESLNSGGVGMCERVRTLPGNRLLKGEMYFISARGKTSCMKSNKMNYKRKCLSIYKLVICCTYRRHI